MSSVTPHETATADEARTLHPEASVVETLRALDTDDGGPVPAGSRGTIVAVYGRGEAYEVEFAHPVVGNCTVPADLIRAV